MCYNYENMARTAKKYRVDFKFNGKVVRKFTDDIDAAITSINPGLMHTDMFIIVKDGKRLIERHLLIQPARDLFTHELNRQVFISNLLLS